MVNAFSTRNTDYLVYTTKNSAKPAVEFQIGPCRLTLGFKVINLLSFKQISANRTILPPFSDSIHTRSTPWNTIRLSWMLSRLRSFDWRVLQSSHTTQRGETGMEIKLSKLVRDGEVTVISVRSIGTGREGVDWGFGGRSLPQAPLPLFSGPPAREDQPLRHLLGPSFWQEGPTAL